MPLCEFQCECGKTTEKIDKYNTKEIQCECGKIAKKLISISSFALKGDGWFDSGYSKSV